MDTRGRRAQWNARARAALAMSFVVVTSLFAAPVLAGDRGKSEDLARQGIAEQEAGRHEAALGLFDRSLTEFDHPMIRFFTARSLVALDRWEGARELYRTLLASCADLGPRNCAEVKQNLATCDETLKATRVHITSGSVEGVAVTLDGRALGLTPLETTLRRGRYVARVEKAGFEPAERRIDVAGQDELRIDIALKAQSSVTVTPTGRGTIGGDDDGLSTKGLWAWITLGGAVASLAGGAGLIGQHFAEVNKSAPEGYEKADVSPVGLYSGGALATVGVGFGIASTVLFVQDSKENKAASAWLLPTTDGFAIGFSGTW
jgi:hypothetical protein